MKTLQLLESCHFDWILFKAEVDKTNKLVLKSYCFSKDSRCDMNCLPGNRSRWSTYCEHICPPFTKILFKYVNTPILFLRIICRGRWKLELSKLHLKIDYLLLSSVRSFTIQIQKCLKRHLSFTTFSVFHVPFLRLFCLRGCHKNHYNLIVCKAAQENAFGSTALQIRYLGNFMIYFYCRSCVNSQRQITIENNLQMIIN